jgi:hypothetical protein
MYRIGDLKILVREPEPESPSSNSGCGREAGGVAETVAVGCGEGGGGSFRVISELISC